MQIHYGNSEDIALEDSENIADIYGNSEDIAFPSRNSISWLLSQWHNEGLEKTIAFNQWTSLIKARDDYFKDWSGDLVLSNLLKFSWKRC